MVNKHICFVVALTLCASLGAQDTRVLTCKDLLNMFNEYNPSVLQRAIDNKHYQSLLNQLTTSYTAPYTDENEVEMIAVAVNFFAQMAERVTAKMDAGGILKGKINHGIFLLLSVLVYRMTLS